jgi:Vitamin B12 dependent methionine synthase, activation domain
MSSPDRSRGSAPPSQPSLRAALAERIIVADGAMGSMLHGSPLTLDDFDGHEGCNEVLNVTRPDVVTSCRYAFGYPACPDLEDRAKVMRLPAPEQIGVELSEEFQLAPEQSTDALIVHHPEAKYFSA